MPKFISIGPPIMKQQLFKNMKKFAFFGDSFLKKKQIADICSTAINRKPNLFHKLTMLLANQILHILCIFIKPNVWYLWSLKILAIKRWFPFNFAKILQGRHFVVGGPKNFKLLADISFESSLQNIVFSGLLLFLCTCC